MPRDDAQKHDDIQQPLLERRAFLSALLAGMAGMPLLLRSEAANAAAVAGAGGATVGAQPSNDPAHLPKMIRASASHWRVPFDGMAIDVRDLSSGRTLLRFNDEFPHAPASTAKLFTTLAALELLNERQGDFRFETRLFRRRSADSALPALILAGGGDPGFTAADLEAMLGELMAGGLTAIEGDILIDRSYFPRAVAVEPKPLSAHLRRTGWEQRWRVGPDAMTIGDRCLTFTFVPQADGTAAVRMSPALDGIDWQKTGPLLPGRCVDWDDRLERDVLELPSGGKRVVFRGGYPGACGKEELQMSLETADAFAERAIRTIWTSVGGTWNGRLRSSADPLETAILKSDGYALAAARRSRSVPSLVRDINKDSINPGAESLFLSLSEERTAEASAAVIDRWLDGRGISHESFVIGGGDGLDSRARVDAKLMGDLLSYAQQSPCWSDFLRSLPEVGVDGTMKRRGLPGVTAYAKTGTLATTRTLAGYVRHRSGRLLSVYGAVWGKSAMPGARAFLDGILLWAASLENAHFIVA